jgi:hypothetical protein
MQYDGINLIINLCDEANKVIECVKERYRQNDLDTDDLTIDDIQESKCFEYAEHDYTDFLYTEIKKKLKEVKK